MNEYIESLNKKLTEKLLTGEIFRTLTEAKMIEQWRKEYNQV